MPKGPFNLFDDNAQSKPGAPGILHAERRLVETMSGGKRTLIVDKLGNANIMNVFHKTTYENLGLAAYYGTGVVQAFKKDSGADFSEIMIGTYQSSGTQMISEARGNPKVSITYDQAIAAHAAKGAGWGTVSRWDWALLVHIMESLNFQPRGNTNHGLAYDAYHEWGQRQDGGLPGDSAGVGNVLTGTGPDSWTHDGSPHGVADLVGNIWEWLHGFKLVDGRVFIDPYNNQGAESGWAAQPAYLNGPSPILDSAKTADTTGNVAWTALPKSGSYVSNELLKRALIEPAGQALPINGRFYVNNTGERLPLGGGARHITANAGPGALSCSIVRTHADSTVGSRSRFAV